MGETYNTGDHTPGDTSNKIQSNYNKYRLNGTWYDANWGTGDMYNSGGSNRMAYDQNNWYGSGFRIWDPRCSE